MKCKLKKFLKIKFYFNFIWKKETYQKIKKKTEKKKQKPSLTLPPPIALFKLGHQ